MAEADTQDGYISTFTKYPQTYADVARTRRRSRARRDDDVVEGPLLVHPVVHVLPRPLVVAHHHGRHAVDDGELLEDVVGVAVVVVDQERPDRRRLRAVVPTPSLGPPRHDPNRSQNNHELGTAIDRNPPNNPTQKRSTREGDGAGQCGHRPAAGRDWERRTNTDWGGQLIVGEGRSGELKEVGSTRSWGCVGEIWGA